VTPAGVALRHKLRSDRCPRRAAHAEAAGTDRFWSLAAARSRAAERQ